MHAHRNTQHRSQSDHILTDMAITDSSMVGAPVVHHTVDILERRFVTQTGNEPGGRPGRIGTFVKHGIDLRIDIHSPSLGDLENRAKSLDKVQTHHSHRHTTLGQEVR